MRLWRRGTVYSIADVTGHVSGVPSKVVDRRGPDQDRGHPHQQQPRAAGAPATTERHHHDTDADGPEQGGGHRPVQVGEEVHGSASGLKNYSHSNGRRKVGAAISHRCWQANSAPGLETPFEYKRIFGQPLSSIAPNMMHAV